MLAFFALLCLGVYAEVQPRSCEEDGHILLQQRRHDHLKAPCDARLQQLLEWKKKAMTYLVIVDRFALPPDTSNDTCKKGSCTIANSANGCYQPPLCSWGNFCGGSFSGIESKLDYLAGMNVDALWLTPITKNVECGYMGYWTQDLNIVSPEFGGEASLKSLSAAMKKKGISYLQDVVYNHFGAPPPKNGSFQWSSGSTDPTNWTAQADSKNHYNGDVAYFKPFDDVKYYHGSPETFSTAGVPNDPKFTIASINQTANQIAWLSSLADLNQTVDYVSDQLFNWTRSLFADLGVDALRLDTCPYIEPSFYERLRQEALGNHYVFGEVLGNLANFSFDIDGYDIIALSTNRSGVKGYILDSMEFQQTFVGTPDRSYTSTGLGAVENYAFFFAAFNAFVSTANGTVLPNNLEMGVASETGADSFMQPVGSLNSLRFIIEKTQKVFGTGPYGYGANSNFLENQDQPRFLYRACQALTQGWLYQDVVSAQTWACNNTLVSESPAPVLLYMNALSILIMLPGVPVLMYGGEQAIVAGQSMNGEPASSYRSTYRSPMWLTGYATSAPLYGFIARLGSLRSSVIEGMGHKEIDEMKFVELTGDIANITDYVLAFERGQALVIISNLANRIDDPGIRTSIVLQTGYTQGQEVCDRLCYRDPSAHYSWELNAYEVSFPSSAPKSCDCVTVGKGGKLTVELGTEPRIYSRIHFHDENKGIEIS